MKSGALLLAALCVSCGESGPSPDPSATTVHPSNDTPRAPATPGPAPRIKIESIECPPGTPPLVLDAVEEAIRRATGSTATVDDCMALARTLQANALESQALIVWTAVADSPAVAASELAGALKGQARCLRSAGDPAATAAIDAAADALPADPWALVAKGEWALEDGETEVAIAAFDEALNRSPNHSWARAGRARAALDAGDGATAESLLRPLATTSPWHASLLDAALAMQGRPAENVHAGGAPGAATRPPSEDPFDLALGAARATREAVIGRVDEAYDARRFDQAMALARRALELLPRDPLAFDRLARVQAATGDVPGCADTLLRACAIAPNDFGSRLNAGSRLLELKRPEDAVAHLEAACALAPDQAEARRLCGIAYGAVGRHGDAVNALEPLERNRQLQDVASRLALAMSLAQSDRAKDAEFVSFQVLSGSRTNETAWLVLSDSIRRQGDLARAAATARKGLEFVPKSANLRAMVARCTKEAQGG